MIKDKSFWKIFWGKFFTSPPMIMLYIMMVFGTLIVIGCIIVVTGTGWWFIGASVLVFIGVWIWDVYEKAEYTHRTGFRNKDEETMDYYVKASRLKFQKDLDRIINSEIKK